MTYKYALLLMLALLLSACETTGDKREPGQTTLEELDRWRAIADSAYDKQQYQRALNHYKKISVAIPNDAEIWFRLANTYNRLNDSENALASYKEVLVRDNTYSKAWYNSSMIQLKNAAQTFHEATEHLPSEDPVYKASISMSEKLLALIEESNKTVFAGFDAPRKPVLSPDEVEVIILHKNTDSGNQAGDRQDKPAQ